MKAASLSQCAPAFGGRHGMNGRGLKVTMAINSNSEQCLSHAAAPRSTSALLGGQRVIGSEAAARHTARSRTAAFPVRPDACRSGRSPRPFGPRRRMLMACRTMRPPRATSRSGTRVKASLEADLVLGPVLLVRLRVMLRSSWTGRRGPGYGRNAWVGGPTMPLRMDDAARLPRRCRPSPQECAVTAEEVFELTKPSLGLGPARRGCDAPASPEDQSLPPSLAHVAGHVAVT
jgi:hypothetical protein